MRILRDGNPRDLGWTVFRILIGAEAVGFLAVFFMHQTGCGVFP